MDNLLRTYAHVRNLLQRNEKKGDVARELKGNEPLPPEYTSPLCLRATDSDSSGPADLLIKNASFFSFSDTKKNIADIAVKNGKISSVGPAAADTVNTETEIFDALGSSVVPGFCDCHLHLTAGSEQARGCNLESISNYDALSKALKKFIQANPEEAVFYAYGLHYTDDPIIPSHKARQALDDIEPNKPVFIYAHDLHTGWANTSALVAANLMDPAPPYPELLRELKLEKNLVLDDNGLPSGELREPPVYFLVEEALRRCFPITVEQKKYRLEKVCHYLASQGLTSVHNMGLDLPEEDIEYLILLLELEEEGRLPLNVYSSCSVVPDKYMLDDIRRAAEVRDNLDMARSHRITAGELRRRLLKLMKNALELRQNEKEVPSSSSIRSQFSHIFSHVITPGHVDEHEKRSNEPRQKSINYLNYTGKVRSNAVKIFMDGVIEKDTAFRLDHHPARGIPAFSRAELDRVILFADRLGLQVAGHCIGNGSVNCMLNSIEAARQENAQIDKKRGERVRHRIEHIELCNSYDIPRFSELDVIASMQALHERQPVTLWHEKVPEIEWPTAFAWRSLISSGATLVFGSDWPIVSCNCLKGVERAVNRKPWKQGMPDQHLELDEALSAFTSSAARAEYAEGVRGIIKPGMQADLVVLTKDLGEVQEKFDEVKVLRTINNGKIVYSLSEN
ncbi:MAG: amidohydrolase [Desulfonatronovibrionaceae bacterium]